MGSRGVRLLLVGLVVLTALGAASAKLNPLPDAGYTDVRDTSCFTCHVTWSPPLREMAIIVPPTDVTADVGEDFEYTVRVRNPWIAELVRFEPSIDISNAPSLTFVGGLPPLLGDVVAGATVPSQIPTSPSSGSASINVTAGTTDLLITLRPNNTDRSFGPDLVLNVYTREGTQGSPDFGPINDNGPGEPEVLHIQGGSELAQLGFGVWTAEAQTTAVGGNLNPGALGPVEFTVSTDKYRNATGETVQFLERDLGLSNGITQGQEAAFSWNLRAIATPEAGESVGIAFNVTSYYEHDDSSTEDLGYTHDSLEVPVAAAPGGGVTFDTEDSTVIVVGDDLDVGVSMARIAEVIGYISAFLVIASIYTGGIFGKGSRRQLNKVFQSAKRRVAFHNFLSYGILLAAIIHLFIFLWPLPNIEGNYHWTLGLIWGSLSTLAMIGLGLTGALQVPMIRRWNYALWRWSHFGLSIAVMLFTVAHILLDGGNFGDVQSSIGWSDPLDNRPTTTA